MIDQAIKILPNKSKINFCRQLKKLPILITGLLILFSASVIYSQNQGGAENEVIAKAQSLFDKKNYQEALPLFAQLVSVHPENPEYNYKFGVCTLNGDRTDRRRPIRYLLNAQKSMGDNADLIYNLGIAYYQNQEFANAMKFLNQYLSKLGPDSPERPSILEKVNSCLNGMNLEHKNIISEIVSKSEFQRDNFHRGYRADDLGGMLVLKPDMFMTNQDKKSGINSYVYITEPRKVLYFSGFENNSTQRDIFRVVMDEKGDYGKPEKLPDNINTSYDEAYPVAADNGLTLYFCSKGLNSLGGYDIYKTTLDTATNTFSDPENLGVGINSPFDDILFIPGKSGQYAYFSTDRDNLNGSINVYKIRLIDDVLKSDQFLAENVIQSKLGQHSGGDKSDNKVGNGSSQSVAKKPVAKQEPQISPSERAAKLVNERAIVNKLADTSYMFVTKTKNLIRDLTNKRDRANAVSEKKEEAAKSLEVKFDAIIAGMASITSDVEFNKTLENAISLKKEIYQYRKRADYSNLIAWNLGKHIKIKNNELEKFKAGAGKVQTFSVSGKIEETKIAYIELKNAYNLADTLTDFSDLLITISSDQATYNVPGAELAFAEDLKKGFENKTLLAATQKTSQPQKQEKIPINIVDKRTHIAEETKPDKPAIKIWPVVTPATLESVELATTLPEEETLEIDFAADAIEPFKLVESIAFNENIPEFDPGDDALEINLNIDMPEIVPLVDQVQMLAYEFNLDEDEAPEINFDVDVIEPESLVSPVEYVKPEFAFMEDEQLEIDNDIDAIEPLDIVQTVAYNEGFSGIEIEDESLEIDKNFDAITPEPLVETVAYDAPALAFNEDIEEELEINLRADAVEALEQIRQVNFDENAYAQKMEKDEPLEISDDVFLPELYPVVQPVTFVTESIAFNIDEEDELEINLNNDAIETVDLVSPVNYDVPAFAQIIGENEQLEISNDAILPEIYPVAKPVETEALVMVLPEEEKTPEIRFDVDRKSTLALIEPVVQKFHDFSIPDDDELEINIETENTKASIEYALVNQVKLEGNTDEFILEDENLEISNDHPAVQILALAEQVNFKRITDFDPDEENLEINIEKTGITPAKLVEPVDANSVAVNAIDLSGETLEISRDEKNPEIIDLVEPVEMPEYVYNAADIDEKELEIRFDKYEQLLLTMPEQVNPVYISSITNEVLDLDDDIEISFASDETTGDEFAATEPEQSQKTARAKSIQTMPVKESDLVYLRESVSLSKEIETSKTDFEILRIAINDPAQLGYEELLFAASLSSNPFDKLRIYNQAFIHIKRDWRAFNNAAVTAMNLHDLDRAECYLYQASLISHDNGKIMNNMGILACYKNDLRTAEKNFEEATELGVNADYNLKIVKNMEQTKSFTTEQLHQEIGEHKYFEVLGDIINYGIDK